MRKLILSGILIFTLILSFICVKTGTSIPKIYSYKDLKSKISDPYVAWIEPFGESEKSSVKLMGIGVFSENKLNLFLKDDEALGLMILNPIMYKLEKYFFEGSTTHQFTGGSNLLAAIIVLAIMILPTVINMSVSAIKAVPQQMRSASLALGATKIQTIFKVTIPAAKSGIMTGIVLGIGRALGEAMAINMVAGGTVSFPLPFNSVRFLTTQLVSEMGYASGLHRQVLFSVGLVLFVFIMIINFSLMKLKKKGAVEND